MTTYALTADWVDNTAGGIEIGNNQNAITTTDCVDYGWLQPFTTHYHYSWCACQTSKITLTLTEAMHLRKMAKADNKLRKTLRKLTPYIEVEVDFPDDD